jgi:hypothetical protein
VDLEEKKYDALSNKKTLASEYKNMEQDREPYLTKAKEAARYTIPSLLKDKHNGSQVQTYEQPNQSIGADGVNNLAAKVTLAMLPPNQPFFKFHIDAADLKKIATEAGQNPDTFETEVNRGLAMTEQLLVDFNEKNGDRICLGEAMKHLYIAGNVFLVHVPKIGLKYYPLNRYVVSRDYCGNVLKAITTETIGFYALPKEIQGAVLEQLKIKEKTEEGKKLEEKELTLYTCYRRREKHWITYQEVEGIEIPRSEGKYPEEACPFMALRYTRIDGESYGRGLIEEYIGDISYLDVLSKSIKEASLAAAKCIALVNPQGQTNIKQLAKTKNGGFCAGKADDVTMLQANKYYDLKTAKEEKDGLERRLNRIFIMKAAIQRDAERVTAEEIREMARDLEEALGNHYSIMSKEFQLAYIRIGFFHLRKEKKNQLPDLIKDKSVKLTVTTGLEALGRGSDLNKLTTFAQIMQQFAPMAQLGMKLDVVAGRVANSLNLDITGVMATQEELAAAQQAQSNNSMMEKVMPNLVNKASDMAMQSQQQEFEQQQV